MKNNGMQKQEGAALAVGLIILSIVSLMSYTSMRGTMLQEKMAAGLHNRTLSHSGANSAVREGETFMYNLIRDTNGVNVEGTPTGRFYNIYSMLEDPLDPANTTLNQTVEAFKQRDWTSSAGTEHSFNFSGVNPNAALKTIPQYIVEEVYSISLDGFDTQEYGAGSNGGNGSVQKSFYITGKGDSGDGKTMSLVQSLYTVVVSSSPNN